MRLEPIALFVVFAWGGGLAVAGLGFLKRRKINRKAIGP